MVDLAQVVKNLPAVRETHVQSLVRNGNPLHYSCLRNLMDRGAWWALVHGDLKSWTRLRAEHTNTPKKNQSMRKDSFLTMGDISITSDMQMTPPLWHKVKRN